LLIHEVMHACGKPQKPVVGAPFDADEIKKWSGNPRGFMAWLREQTMSLGKK
jgi:hypothetical protein